MHYGDKQIWLENVSEFQGDKEADIYIEKVIFK